VLNPKDNTPRAGTEFALRLGMPRSAGDLARLILVCFIAGFLERLIPDTLDRLIARRLIHFEGPPPSGVPGRPPGGEQGQTTGEKAGGPGGRDQSKSAEEKPGGNRPPGG